jgi:hypothetical protein
VFLPTLDQSEPSARDTVVRTLLPFRHGETKSAKSKAPLQSARSNYSARASDSAIKMNVAASRHKC